MLIQLLLHNCFGGIAYSHGGYFPNGLTLGKGANVKLVAGDCILGTAQTDKLTTSSYGAGAHNAGLYIEEGDLTMNGGALWAESGDLQDSYNAANASMENYGTHVNNSALKMNGGWLYAKVVGENHVDSAYTHPDGNDDNNDDEDTTKVADAIDADFGFELNGVKIAEPSGGYIDDTNIGYNGKGRTISPSLRVWTPRRAVWLRASLLTGNPLLIMPKQLCSGQLMQTSSRVLTTIYCRRILATEHRS